MAQTDSVKKANEARQWLESNLWREGLKTGISPSVNAVEFERQYNAARETWDKAFEFLGDSTKLATLEPGKYLIDGENAYAIITDAPSKAPETAKWESHEKYIDIQYVIRGEEKIELAPISELTLTLPYNEAKDVTHYSGNGTYYIATPKEFYLFFPNDVHRPNIKVDGYDTVKKLVIKIKVWNSPPAGYQTEERLSRPLVRHSRPGKLRHKAGRSRHHNAARRARR